MHLHQLGNLLTQLLRLQRGKDVALLVRLDTRRPVSWCEAGPGGALRAETACVRLMQAQAEIGFSSTDYCLYSTAAPTSMCLGMAIRCHVNYIVFPVGDEIKFNDNRDINMDARVLTTEMTAMIAGHWAAEVPWLNVEKALVAKRAPPQAWIAALDRVPEVNNIWFTLFNTRELQPVASPKFVGANGPVSFFAQPFSPLRNSIYMKLAWALVDSVRHRYPHDGNSALEGQKIACILVSSGGSILSWGINTNLSRPNITRHAEMNCVQSYFLKQPKTASLPSGCRLYTTLQCCEMCAGMLSTVATDLTVVFGARDTQIGPTALQNNSRNCKEEPYKGGGSNPIARLQLLALIAKKTEPLHRERVSSVKKEYENIYRDKHPAPERIAKSRPTLEEMNSIIAAKKLETARKEQAGLRIAHLMGHSRVNMNLTHGTPAQAVTKALSSPAARQFISQYASEFFELSRVFESSSEASSSSVSVAAAPAFLEVDYEAWMAGVALLNLLASSPALI